MKKTARLRKESFFEKVSDEIKKEANEINADQKKGRMSIKRVFIKKIYLFIAVLIIVIIICSILVLLSINSKKLLSAKNTNTAEIQELIDEVGEKIVLPAGETPTIATITDITKLEGQPFFNSAQNGDKVIIFGSTQQAILYRPSIKKIIAVAPINASNPATTRPNDISVVTPSPDQSPIPTKADAKLKIAVLNSTKEVGLAKKGADLLNSESFEIVTTANALGEYDTTTISNVGSGGITDNQLKKMSQYFPKVKPVITSLPKDEIAPPDAEIVVILGSDFANEY